MDPKKRKTSQGECCQNVGVRLFKCGERRRQAREQQTLHEAEMKLAHEMKECTFFPQTNCACRLVLSRNDENSLSLYERGVRQQLRRQWSEEEGREQKALEELQGCTFHPAINAAPLPSPRALVHSTELEKASTMRELGDCCNCQPAKAEDVASSVLTMLQGWKGRRPIEQQTTMPLSFSTRDHGVYSLCTYADWPSSGACNKSVHRESSQPSLSSIAHGANKVSHVAPAVATGCSQESSFSTQKSWAHSAGLCRTAVMQDEAAAVQNRSSGKIQAQAAGDAQLVICMLEDWKAGRQAGGPALGAKG